MFRLLQNASQTVLHAVTLFGAQDTTWYSEILDLLVKNNANLEAQSLVSCIFVLVHGRGLW